MKRKGKERKEEKSKRMKGRRGDCGRVREKGGRLGRGRGRERREACHVSSMYLGGSLDSFVLRYGSIRSSDLG